MTDGKGPANREAYRRAGVNVAAGDRSVQLLRGAIESTRRPEVVAIGGGFGGAIAIPSGYRDPLIVASTDGAGTKTVLASALGRWDTIGIDLVAMSADDVVCTGAEPLAFLDYVAVGQLDPEAVAELVGGVAAGCREAGCALVGGETAEHPGLMDPGSFDVSGTCVGIVERDDLLDGRAARAGDVMLGLPSSGLHANGFSLVRALVTQRDIPYSRPYQEQLALTLGDAGRDAAISVEPGLALSTLGEVLLTPTTIYARRILALRAALRAAGHDLRGVAHITGGGLPGNVARMLPPDLGARVDPGRWTMPSVMWLLGALGGLDEVELRATFNGGIGMALVIPAEAVPAAIAEVSDAVVIGEVVEAATLGGRYVEAPLELEVAGLELVGRS
ncbi:MAG: phosphoribosylformylglycinamidine cyclo-ligase [Chloroflexota bacterium]